MPARLPPVAATLGYAGALPFVAGAAAMIWRPDLALEQAVLGYGAVILSFLGGIHWGVGMSGGEVDAPRLLASVAPALTGWVALLLGGPAGLLLLAPAFALLLVWDLASGRGKVVPAWYPQLRLPLTAIVTLSLLAVIWRAS